MVTEFDGKNNDWSVSKRIDIPL